jgi:Tfp pilus assembly protein PilO
MKTKEKINLLIVLVILLVILTAAFVVYPLLGGIRKNSQELVSQKKNLAILESKVANLEKFKIIYKELEEILGKINDLFVDPGVPVEFISFLEERAKESHLETKITPTVLKGTEEDPWPFLSFQINSTGSFPDVLSFLKKIENSSYLIEIKNLNISKVEASDNVQAIFSIKVYTK